MVIIVFKWLGATQTTSHESRWRPHLPQIWPGASLRAYINGLQALVWVSGRNQVIQAVKRQFEAKLGFCSGYMSTPINLKVVGQISKYFRDLMYSWAMLFPQIKNFLVSIENFDFLARECKKLTLKKNPDVSFFCHFNSMGWNFGSILVSGPIPGDVFFHIPI